MWLASVGVILRFMDCPRVRCAAPGLCGLGVIGHELALLAFKLASLNPCLCSSVTAETLGDPCRSDFVGVGLAGIDEGAEWWNEWRCHCLMFLLFVFLWSVHQLCAGVGKFLGSVEGVARFGERCFGLCNTSELVRAFGFWHSLKRPETVLQCCHHVGDSGNGTGVVPM